nr:glycosyltransferase [Gemmatimonadota bacterium]
MPREAFASRRASARNGSIAIFLPSLTGGGAQRAMVNLATGFASRGWRTDMVLARATGVYLSEVGDGVRLVDLRARRTLTSLPGLAAYLRSARPTVLLTTINHANVIATWARRLARVPTRLVLREANTASVAMRRTERWRDRGVLAAMRSCYRAADGIVAVSDGVAEDLSSLLGLPPARVEVIYNPVVTEDLAARAAEPLDHPWFLPDSPPVILAVGRLHHQKDYGTLIRAFQRVRSERPARLLILGEGKERLALEELVRELGVAEDVSLPGFVQNPFAYMARSALFVLSSAWEGLPAVLVQA